MTMPAKARDLTPRAITAAQSRLLAAVCPEADRHTPAPTGYISWHRWATRMARTHHQVLCPGCGRWEVWVVGRPPLAEVDVRGRHRRLLAAAEAVLARGHGNLRGRRYEDRRDAHDDLRSVLASEYGR